MQLAPQCSDDVLQNADLLAVLIIEPRHALIDVADDFVVDRAQHIRNTLARQERSVLVVAEERRGRADLGLPVSYTHLRAHETGRNLVCRLLLEKKKTYAVLCLKKKKKTQKKKKKQAEESVE